MDSAEPQNIFWWKFALYELIYEANLSFLHKLIMLYRYFMKKVLFLYNCKYMIATSAVSLQTGCTLPNHLRAGTYNYIL